MGKSQDYESRTEKLILPILEKENFELVDVEYVKEAGVMYLRAYIDKPGGITIDDCELVSRALSDELDKEDFISEEYTLEISSPGLGRPLKKDKDFDRSIGSEVDIKLFKPIDGEKEYSGILKSYNATSVEIEISKEETRSFERSAIALIRLAFDF